MRLRENENSRYDETLIYIHDIKNILASIINLAGNIKRKSIFKSSKKYADEIKKAAEDCSSMLSLLKGEITDKTYETVNLHSVINLQVKLFSAKKIKIKKDLRANNANIYCNRISVENAIYNVMLNGIQSCQHRAKLHIITYNKVMMTDDERSKELIVIEIRDNGKGIEISEMNRIFDKGFTTKKDGAGIGLYSAAAAIESIGGEITAENKNKGAVFTICLPVRC